MEWLQKWEENKSKVLINLCVCICVKNSELGVHLPGSGIMEGKVLGEVEFRSSCPMRSRQVHVSKGLQH